MERVCESCEYWNYGECALNPDSEIEFEGDQIACDMFSEIEVENDSTD